MLRKSSYVLLSAVFALLAGSSARVSSSARLLVAFHPGVSPASRAATLARVDARVQGAVPGVGVRVVSVPAGAVGAALALLRSTRGVAFAERDTLVRAAATAAPADPLYAANAWPFARTFLPIAWSASTGAGVTVAVVDTGVNATGDLAGAVLPGVNLVGGADERDDNGHGTEVASVLAGRANNGLGSVGVCWSCNILPVKALGANGSGLTSTVAAGVVWAADHGARVINLSLGGTQSDQTLASAVAYAQGKGAVVVAAAGNGSSTSLDFPAAYPGVVAVAGSDPADVRYGFSNYGGGVSLAAPGCALAQNLAGAFATACGTSISTPFVSGVAALAFSLAPAATAAQVTQALTVTAKPVPGSYVAHGLVDASATLDALGASLPLRRLTPLGLPAVVGDGVVGSTLRALPGAWAVPRGTHASFSYAWVRCAGPVCTPAGGGQALTVTPGDLGATLRVAVTARSGRTIMRTSAPPVGPIEPNQEARRGGLPTAPPPG
jgi:subtilisin family serine protease